MNLIPLFKENNFQFGVQIKTQIHDVYKENPKAK